MCSVSSTRLRNTESDFYLHLLRCSLQKLMRCSNRWAKIPVNQENERKIYECTVVEIRSVLVFAFIYSQIIRYARHHFKIRDIAQRIRVDQPMWPFLVNRTYLHQMITVLILESELCLLFLQYITRRRADTKKILENYCDKFPAYHVILLKTSFLPSLLWLVNHLIFL